MSGARNEETSRADGGDDVRVERATECASRRNGVRGIVRRVRRAFLGRPRNERGLALIFVLSLVGVIIAVLGEVMFESQITVRTSIGERDRIRAEMAALTGAQFAKFLITLDSQINGLTDEGNKAIPDQIKGAAKAGIDAMKQGLGKPLFQLMDGFPIGAEGFEGIEDLAKININAMLDEGLLNALKTVPGYFVLKTTNESSKLNVNLLEGAERVVTVKALTRLFSTPREAKFLEEKGFPPARLAANVKDYIDRDTIDDVDRSDEEAQYQTLKFTHKPKNGRLESLEELRRVPGFHDDEIYDLFSPYLTVWPLDAKEKSLDVNAAPVELLSALFTKEGNEPDENDFDKLEDARAENKQFDKVQELSEFFTQSNQDKDTKDVISRLVGLRSNIYRVEVRGVSNNIERTLVMVFETVKPKSGAPARPPTPAPGATPDPNAAAAASGADAASSSANSGGGLRLVYQRFY